VVVVSEMLSGYHPHRRFYLYPCHDFSATFRWSYDQFFYNRWCEESYRALLNHRDRTDDPEDAAFFVIGSTLRCVSFARIDYQALNESLRTLPFVRSDRMHVVFDLSDYPRPALSGRSFIVCKSAFHETFYNPSSCVSIPQFPRYHFDRPFLDAKVRPHLACFKGNLRLRHTNLRTRLLTLHDNNKFVITAGVLKPSDIQINPDGTATECVQPGEQPYVDTLFASTFALLPRGRGYALSYRMVEAMNAGCVPVIISDGYVLPFSECLNYESFSVRIAEAEVEMLPELLETKLDVADLLQRKAHAVFLEYFSSTKQIINHAIGLIQQIVRNSPRPTR